MRDLAASGIAIAKSLRVLGFSRQSYYEWLGAPVSDRDRDDAELTNAAMEIQREDPEFGYRFVADELKAAGWKVSEKRACGHFTRTSAAKQVDQGHLCTTI